DGLSVAQDRKIVGNPVHFFEEVRDVNDRHHAAHAARTTEKRGSTSSAPRLLVGSSRMSTRQSGSASARAISTSCWAEGGKSPTRASGENRASRAAPETRSSAESARRRTVFLCTTPSHAGSLPRAMFSSTVKCGQSESS